jgi:hypothetical protein
MNTLIVLTFLVTVFATFNSFVQLFMTKRIAIKERMLPIVARIEKKIVEIDTTSSLKSEDFEIQNWLTQINGWDGFELTQVIANIQFVGEQRREQLLRNGSTPFLLEGFVRNAEYAEWQRILSNNIDELRNLKEVYPFYINIKTKKFNDEIDLVIEILKLLQQSNFDEIKSELYQKVKILKEKELLICKKINDLRYKTFIYSPHLAYWLMK